MSTPCYGCSGVPHHPTHRIHDATKLDCYMACPRKHFYEYYLGWRPESPNVHLHTGAAFHIAMERLLRLQSRDKKLLPSHVDEAFELFLAEYRKHFAAIDDHLRTPKDPESVRWALDEYIRYYAGYDQFEVLHTEIGGAVPLTDAGDLVYFNIDALVRDHNEGGAIKVIDHKTAKLFPRNWSQSWLLTIQFGLYTHAMRCIFNDFWGVVINGIRLVGKPRIAADGKVYKQDADKSPAFQRANVRYSDAALEAWYYDVLHWHAALEADEARLCEASPDDLIMRAFPRNYKACGSYSGCPFFSYCWAWDNPLKQCSQPPAGFKVEFWNPADRANEGKALLTVDPATHHGTITEKEQNNV